LDKLIEKGREIIRDAEKILVFSGAGLSTESGIPDFRSPGGVWTKYDPSDFYFHKIISDEQVRVKYWRMSSEMYRDMKEALPGTAFSVSCLSCGKKYDRDEIEDRLKAGMKAPDCDDCGGVLKPETISFGQSMPHDKLALAMKLARDCDLCLVLGSSLVVYPAASVPQEASSCGARLIIVNRDETPLDARADAVIRASVTDVMKKMVV
jgi:NAD-dependent deacetylase